MENVNGCESLICRGNEVEGPIGERRMWMAVLVQAVEDWRGDSIRASRAAEEFLFHNHEDFDSVCTGAGVDPGSFRSQLRRLRGCEIHIRPAQLAA